MAACVAIPVIENQRSASVSQNAVEERLDRLRDDGDHDHHDERRADEQQPVEAPHAPLVEAAHALRVDEHRPEAQAREERRRHPAPALVEELDHRRVRADRDDELSRPPRTRAASRRPRSCPRRRTRGTARPTRAGSRARRPPVGVHVVHEIGAGRQRALGHRVEVADDDVGLEAHLEQRVGAAVDADEHRPVLADVGAQAARSSGSRGRARRRARAGRRIFVAQRRQLERLERRAAPRAATYSSVFSAKRSSSTPIATRGLLHRGLDLVARRSTLAGRERARRPRQTSPSTIRRTSPSRTRVDDVLTGVVDRAGCRPRRMRIGPAVRVAAGDRRRGVHDRRDAARRPGRRPRRGRGPGGR